MWAFVVLTPRESTICKYNTCDIGLPRQLVAWLAEVFARNDEQKTLHENRVGR